MSGCALTVTHRNGSRLFITVNEAVSLLLLGSSIGRRGEILSLEMGKPIRILDLAKNLIRLCGKDENHFETDFTGLRPGEKLPEELFYTDEQVLSTSCDRIKRAVRIIPTWPKLKSQLDMLQNALYKVDDFELLRQIQGIIPEYRFEMNFASAVDDPMGISDGRTIGSPQAVRPENLIAQLGCD